MLTRPRIFKQSSTTVANRVPPRGNLYLVLMIALCIQTAGQTKPAQAAPPADEVEAFLSVLNAKDKVCLGSSANYVAAVFTRVTDADGNLLAPKFSEPGIRIEASSNDPSIMQPASTNDFYYHTTGFGSGGGEQPHTAEFLFTAKNIGSTSIDFEAVVRGAYRDTSVSVQVVNCKFKVSTISRWSGSSPYGSMKMVAISHRPVVLEFKDPTVGGSASTNVAWVETTIVPRYKETNSLRFGKLDVKGLINDQGRLLLTVRLQPVTFSQSICAPIVGCGGGSVTSTPDSLELWVSSDYGGTRTYNGGITDEGGTMFGPTTVYVVPVKK